ncbi:hypothetical protein T12_16176 [Trichinella patagoniensis]|uniref:Uncharacterized protein n=1 Tax=Trichinella patagoniensis TaxID=990121 RepID=A0A0V0ZYV9_9BILA|nr:hypothetical protein T12_16176 [Trichinella patagoniensis]
MTELGPEMEVRGGEDGDEAFSVRQDREAMKGKCICGDYWKIATVNQVEIFVELTRKCETSGKFLKRENNEVKM